MKERDTPRSDKDRLTEEMIKELQKHNIPTYSLEINTNYIWNKHEIKSAGLSQLNKKELLGSLLEIESAIHKDDPNYKFKKKGYLESSFQNKKTASDKQKTFIKKLMQLQKDSFDVTDIDNITSFSATIAINMLKNKFEPIKVFYTLSPAEARSYSNITTSSLKEINTRLKNARANNTMLIRKFNDQSIINTLKNIDSIYRDIQSKIKSK